MRESAAIAAKEQDAPAERGPVRLFAVDLDEAWPHLESELERVRAKGARWPIAWVKNRLDTQNAAAFRLWRDGEHLAYLVVERIASYDVCLNVWILTASVGALSLADRDQVIGLIDQLSRDVGATRWRAEGRHGWAWVLKGRARTSTIFERDVK